ncbi:MAG TPA: hypothetical protein VFG69_19785 [Nannocystaceae bacterium]|nr:hypothetical protein [Nannocystaceae bacterium]
MGTRIAIRLLLLCVAGCGKGDAGRNDELPATLRGNYGQKPEQAQLPTVGLEVDAHSLRLGELTITIVQGEASESGDFHVTKAEARWEKSDKTKTCKGTVSRQGGTLLVSLFVEDGDEHCEGVLEGEWKVWTRSDVLPEHVLGTYGSDVESQSAAMGLRFEPKTIAWTDGGATIDIVEVVQWPDKPDEVFVRDSKYGGVNCIGSIVRKDRELALTLAPAAGSPEGISCLSGRGSRWTIDPAHVPTAKLTNGKVEIGPADGKLVLVAKDIGLRCETSVLRTSERTVLRSRSDGLGVTAGALLVLAPAVPTGGTEACRERIRNVAHSECTEQMGAPCSPDELQAFVSEDLECPRQIAIGEPAGGGRKAALMPQSAALLACWDMTGTFRPAAP